MSPDGSEVAFRSLRSGEHLLWLKPQRRLQPPQARGRWQRPKWLQEGGRPTGVQMVFDATIDGNRDIYVADTTTGRWKQLTFEPSADGIASWSIDGRWIYFVSNRSEWSAISKMPSEGGPATQVTFREDLILRNQRTAASFTT